METKRDALTVRDLWAVMRVRMIDVIVRTPPARDWLWSHKTGLRVLAFIVWGIITAGFIGGAIPQMIVGMGLPGVSALLAIAQCLPLVLAARWPVVAWRLMTVAMFGGILAAGSYDLAWPWPVTSCLAMLFVLVQVGACHGRDTAVGVGLITVLALVVPAWLITPMPVWVQIVLGCGVALALLFGDSMGGRYAAEVSLAEQTELRRQDLARQAVLAERSRIARELHDVVAHHMSVIAVQAEAAPYKFPELPEKAVETFGVIRDSARDALSETRRVVGLLREDDETAERAPQPGLDLLDELAETARGSGLTVKVDIIGMPRPVSPGLDLTAYRIVQEALSNAVRYAPGGNVLVEIRYGTAALRVAVLDGGAVSAPPSEPGGGHGLVGMRERVAMHGGIFVAQRREGGGFLIAAEIPYETPA